MNTDIQTTYERFRAFCNGPTAMPCNELSEGY